MDIVLVGILSVCFGLGIFYLVQKPILAWIKDGGVSKQVNIIFFAELIFSLIGFCLVYITTEPPTGGSGNGNPWLIFYGTPTGALFLNSCFLLGLFIFNWKRISNKYLYFLLLIVFLILICCGVLEYQFASRLIHTLGSFHDPNSVIYAYPLSNVYTNSLFFNIFTFLGVYMISILVGLLFKLPFGRQIFLKG